MTTQETLVDAATDPFLVIVEYHPNATEVANAEMKRAADRFRLAVAAVVSGTPPPQQMKTWPDASDTPRSTLAGTPPPEAP